MSSDIPSINVTEEESLSSCLDIPTTSDYSLEEALSLTNLSSEESLSTFSLKDIIKDELDETSEDTSKLSDQSDIPDNLGGVEKDSQKATFVPKSPKTASKENRDASPFKEAIRGFVLSKLTKKSEGASHVDTDRKTLFSGIKEKIVKKLEDSTVKETSSKDFILGAQDNDNCADSLSNVTEEECELKSVVANDKFGEVAIEDAMECFEEFKLLPTNGIYPGKECGASCPPSLIPHRSHTMSNISLASHKSNLKSNNDRSISMTFSELQKTEEEENDENNLEGKLRSSSVPEVVSSVSAYDSCESVCAGFKILEEDLKDDSTVVEKKRFLEYLKELFVHIQHVFQRGMKLDVLVLVLGVVTYYFFHNWPFLCGILCGILIAIFFCHLYIQFTRSLDDCDTVTSCYKSLPPAENILLRRRTYFHEGWMNTLNGDYDPPTFKLTDTVSVFVKVDVGKLHLSYPKRDVPKRAMWNEKKIHIHSFIREEFYTLFDAKVILLPECIRPTRIWNKRYPICVMLSSEEEMKQEAVSETKSEDDPDIGSKPPSNNSSQSGSLSNTPVHGPTKRNVFYLFSRTDREKEEWYWKLYFASKKDYELLDLPFTAVKSDLATTLQNIQEDVISGSSPGPSKSYSKINLSSIKETEETSKQNAKPILDFYHYMNLLINNELQTGMCDNSANDVIFQWLNVFLGRLTYDMLVQKKWTDEAVLKIQRKLNRIKMPSYMQKLVVTDVYLGTSLPQIKKISEAVLDDRGIWLDLDIDYQGYFQMTLEAKLKTLRHSALDKLQSSDIFGADESETIAEELGENWDDDEDMLDSETSKEDSPLHHPPSVSAGTKILQSVGKWVGSGSLSENSFVKRYVGQFMQTRLLLTVEVDSIKGTLAVNLPPRPSDRVWFGFRNNPKLSLNIFPKVGERQISLLPVIQLIKRKLIDEIQKAIVMPNMEDLTISIMHSTVYEQ